MNDEIIYITGMTPTGKLLKGGIWTLAHQEGFPLAVSHDLAQSEGWAIDWLEAMCDASRDNNLPALMKQATAFLDADTIDYMKAAFMMAKEGATYDQILQRKREIGRMVMEASNP